MSDFADSPSGVAWKTLHHPPAAVLQLTAAAERPDSFRVLTVGDWPLSCVHATLRELAIEGYTLCAAVEDGGGGLELWLVQRGAGAVEAPS